MGSGSNLINSTKNIPNVWASVMFSWSMFTFSGARIPPHLKKKLLQNFLISLLVTRKFGQHRNLTEWPSYSERKTSWERERKSDSW